MAYIDDRRRPKTRSRHSLEASTVPIDTIKSENVNIALIVPTVESRMDDALILKSAGNLGDYRATKHRIRSLALYLYSLLYPKSPN